MSEHTAVTFHPGADLLAAVDHWAHQRGLGRGEALLERIQRGLDDGVTFHNDFTGPTGSVTHLGDVQGDLNL